jgi:hypothetical protein
LNFWGCNSFHTFQKNQRRKTIPSEKGRTMRVPAEGKAMAGLLWWAIARAPKLADFRRTRKG